MRLSQRDTESTSWLSKPTLVVMGALILIAESLLLLALHSNNGHHLSGLSAIDKSAVAEAETLTEAVRLYRQHGAIALLDRRLEQVDTPPHGSDLPQLAQSHQWQVMIAGVLQGQADERPMALVPLPDHLTTADGPAFLLFQPNVRATDWLLDRHTVVTAALLNLVLILIIGALYQRAQVSERRAAQHKRSAYPLLSSSHRFVAKSEFTALLESMPHAVIVLDEHLNIQEANASVAQLLSKGKDAISGRMITDVADVVDSAGQSILVTPLQDAFDNLDEILTITDCYLLIDDTRISLTSAMLSVLSHNRTNAKRFALILCEDGSLEELNSEYQQNQYLLNAIYHHLPAQVYLKDKRSVFVTANQSFAAFLGMKQPDVIGARPSEIYSESSAAEALNRLEHRVRESHSASFSEVEFADGRVLLQHEFPVNDHLDRLLYIGGIAIDITRQKRLEHAFEALASEQSNEYQQGRLPIESLAARLRNLTQADGVLIGQMVGKTSERVQLISCQTADEQLPLFCFSSERLPSITFNESTNQNPLESADLSVLFPDSPWSSSVNRVLENKDGSVQGIIALLFETATPDTHLLRETLDLFASRIWSEIARFRLYQRVQRVSNKFAQLIDNTPLAVIEWKPDFTVVEWNSSAARLFEYSREQALGQTLNALVIAPIRWAYDSALLQHCITYRSNAKCNHINVSQSGQSLQCEWDNTVILDEDGDVESVISVVKDVTAERYLMSRIQHKEKEQRMMLDSMVDAVITICEHGKVTSFNAAAESMFGYSAHEIIGLNVKVLMPDNEAEHHDEYIARHVQTGQNKLIGASREVTGKRSNGSTFPMRLSVNKLPANEREKHRYIGTCVDITDEKRKDSQLRQANKMDAIGRLTGGVAHDFNNILGIINGYAELLELKLDDKDNQKFAGEILKASQRGERLTSSLLKFTRQRAAEIQSININDVLQSQEEMLQRSLTPRISMRLELESDLPPIQADKNELEDALLNLCINAMHAMDNEGEITIRSQRRECVNPDNDGVIPQSWVVLEVQDTGKGISKELQQRVFEPFFSTKEEGKGTGLGLSQIYGFVKRAEGFITVDSEPDKGATFTLHFPAQHHGQQPTQPEANVDKPYTGNETLLLVDDEVALSEVLSTSLAHYGYNLITAESADEALDKLNAHNEIDLVISDVVMRGRSGFDLAKDIDTQFDLPVILISGYYDESQKHDASSHYATLIHKPFNARTLLDSIRNTLNSEKNKDR